MFKINDVIVYGAEGVFKIADIEEKTVAGVRIRYFVLKPENGRQTTVYVPTDKETLLAKMRKVPSKAEVTALIESIPDIEPKWIGNENERKETYKRTLTGGDYNALLVMLKTLYFHKREQEANGKHLYLSDERFLKAAEQRLSDEWQYVLGMDREALMSCIFAKVKNT